MEINKNERAASGSESKNPNSGLLLSIVLNIALPSIVLAKFSSPERLGPVLAFWVALSFPISAGLWELVKSRKANLFSGIGLVNVLLTGGLGFMAVDVMWFAVKETVIPFVLGLAVLVSIKTKTPLVQTLLLNDVFINMARIRERLSQSGRQSEFDSLVLKGSVLFSVSFFMSAVLNFGLARYLLKSPVGSSDFNAELGKMTAMSFPVIAVPVLVFTGIIFWYLFSGISRITSLSKDEILLNQKQ